MKICTAQIRPLKGDIGGNIAHHQALAALAADKGAQLILFPELSLTAYEPTLAKELATDKDDKRLAVFQELSNAKNISIALGLPTKAEHGTQISMIIFQPYLPSESYAKQKLHADELPYFVEGRQQAFWKIDNKKFAPAICYESLFVGHAAHAAQNGADIYLASVAKPAHGVAKALKHYPHIARQYGFTVLMSNSIGPCDDFESMGSSAIWNKEGKLLGQLDNRSEGLLIYDIETEEIIAWTKAL